MTPDEEKRGTFISQDKIDNFYGKFARKIDQWDENVEKYRNKYSLLKAIPVKTIIRLIKAGPQVLHLLISLLNHEEVTRKTKARVSAAIAYFIFPFDALPEGLIGPIGYLDDIVIALMLIEYLLNGKNEREKEIITELWQGTPEELTVLRGILKGIDVVRYLEKQLRKIVPGIG